jgi:carnitine O-acetyltransferase
MTFFCLDGFFDAGMLLQALKANQDNKKTGEQDTAATIHRRSVGKKLRLTEY